MRLPPATALILGLIAAGAAWPQSEPGYIEQQQRMTTLRVFGLVESWLDETGVPGAAVAMVAGDQTLMLEGFGRTNTRGNAAVDPETTIFRVGNLVRALTATVALQMVEQGIFDLGADISHSSGLEILAHDSLGPVTLAHLLLHTAGIDQRQVATRARTRADLATLGRYLEHRMPPRVRPSGVVSVPSNHGYALVGRLVELAAAASFESRVETALLAPLGMSNTAISDETLPSEQIATGHRWRMGRLTEVSPDYSQTAPASTLLTTAADMARWMRIVLGDGSLGGRQVLDTTSIDQLLERQIAPHESLPGRTLAFKEGRYLSPRELSLASTGNGFSAVMVLLPARRVGLFAAFNSEIDFWDLVYQILDPFDAPGGPEPNSAEAAETSLGYEPTGYWQDAAVSLASAEKLRSLVRQDRIRSAADGALIWRSRAFSRTDSRCFQERDGLTRLCFVDGPGSTRFVAVGDLLLEKLAWHAARPFQFTLWVAFAALFLATGWPRASLPRRHLALRPSDTFSPRWPDSCARLAAALHFVFIASLAAFLATNFRSGSTTLLYEVPVFLLLVLSLPLVAAGLTIVAVGGLVPLWHSPRSTRGYRLRVTLLISALVAFLPFLWSWNLLGFHI